MNYLKSYKLFESFDIDEITDNIDDICLDLTDDGFDVPKQISVDGKKWWIFNEEVNLNGQPIKSEELTNLIKDEFYQLNINIYKNIKYNGAAGCYSMNYISFDVNDVKESVNRLANYAKVINYNCTICYQNKRAHTESSIEEFNKFNGETEYVVVAYHKREKLSTKI